MSRVNGTNKCTRLQQLGDVFICKKVDFRTFFSILVRHLGEFVTMGMPTGGVNEYSLQFLSVKTYFSSVFYHVHRTHGVDIFIYIRLPYSCNECIKRSPYDIIWADTVYNIHTMCDAPNGLNASFDGHPVLTLPT